jgi:DNA-binding transcriptional MerR regulator
MPLDQIAFDFEDAPVASVQEEKAVVAEKTKPSPIKVDNKKMTRGRMSLKEMDAGLDLIDVPEDEVLFQKMYYSMSEVAGMFKVNQSLIRFWENEFDILKPKKNGKGDRLFRPEDVKNLKLIYHLLRERKYTIEGAKDFLRKNKKVDEKFAMIESLKKLKGFLNELKANL